MQHVVELERRRSATGSRKRVSSSSSPQPRNSGQEGFEHRLRAPAAAAGDRDVRPLAEELLKGEFAGKHHKIEVKKVGDSSWSAASDEGSARLPPPEPVGRRFRRHQRLQRKHRLVTPRTHRENTQPRSTPGLLFAPPNHGAFRRHDTTTDCASSANNARLITSASHDRSDGTLTNAPPAAPGEVECFHAPR